MTKKDYIVAARVIRFRTDEGTSERTSLCDAFVEFFRCDNFNFDAERFHAAVYEGEIKTRRNAKKTHKI